MMLDYGEGTELQTQGRNTLLFKYFNDSDENLNL
jgi:hypothetical protein